jgi:hypothetical protein
MPPRLIRSKMLTLTEILILKPNSFFAVYRKNQPFGKNGIKEVMIIKLKMLLYIGIFVFLVFSAIGHSSDKEFWGQIPPGKNAVQFAPEFIASPLCPHGQLLFSQAPKTIYWSAISGENSKQAIYYNTFDGKNFSPPYKASFAADSNDGGPALAPDGKRIFFNAEIPFPNNPTKSASVICVTGINSSGPGKPTPIESTIDTIMNKGQVSVARNGNIYFSGRIFSERTPAIFICKYLDGKYLAPEKLSGGIASLPLVVDPWIDPDERFMLLACPPKEGPPMLTDIGISIHKADGSWSEPINIGKTVNTPAFERFPALSSDGKYLFFIRSAGDRFVNEQARYYWINAGILDSLIN